MPAIRFLFNASFEVATPTYQGRSGHVEVRLHGGQSKRFPILGFICTAATELMPEGAYAKVLASYVTHDENSKADEWIKVENNQVVCGWRVQVQNGDKLLWGVYIIVGQNGCPLIAVDSTYSPPQGPKSSNVHFLDKAQYEKQPSTKKLS